MAAKGITATAAVFVLIASTVAWSAFTRSSDGASGPRRWTQTINTSAKGDRLTAGEQAAPVILASAEAADVSAANPANAFAQSMPAQMMLASVDPRTMPFAEQPAQPAPKPAVAAPAPKPKAAPPSGLLDEGQIAGLRGRLRLTADQAEYWPAVEVALRDVIRHQTREMRKQGARAKSAPPIDVNSEEVQRLISAALPLLMQLREDQKKEVRQMARIIGLEQVARQI